MSPRHEPAAALAGQSRPAHEWLRIVNGPIAPSALDLIKPKAQNGGSPRVFIEPRPIGIVPALRLGRQAASGDDVISGDGDDFITRLEHPARLFNDKDLLARANGFYPNGVARSTPPRIAGPTPWRSRRRPSPSPANTLHSSGSPLCHNPGSERDGGRAERPAVGFQGVPRVFPLAAGGRSLARPNDEAPGGRPPALRRSAAG